MELSVFVKEWPNLSVGEDGILRCSSVENPGSGQIIVPWNLTSMVLQMLHNDLGHFGTAKTSARVKERFLWLHMSLDIEELSRNCLPCQRRKNPVPARRTPLQPIITSRPGELVTMDIVEYPLSSQGYRYCLVVVDHFSKWLELYPLRNQKSETIARKVFDCWVPQHGAPEQIHHDQGKNLTVEMIQEICSFFEIWNTQTTPFHPNRMGHLSEAFVQWTVCWQRLLRRIKGTGICTSQPRLTYNTAVHSITGFSHSFLRFGRELHLPSDLLQPDSYHSPHELHSDYAAKLKSQLTRAFQTTSETLKVSHRTQKAYYDHWARDNAYQVGD